MTTGGDNVLSMLSELFTDFRFFLKRRKGGGNLVNRLAIVLLKVQVSKVRLGGIVNSSHTLPIENNALTLYIMCYLLSFVN